MLGTLTALQPRPIKQSQKRKKLGLFAYESFSHQFVASAASEVKRSTDKTRKLCQDDTFFSPRVTVVVPQCTRQTASGPCTGSSARVQPRATPRPRRRASSKCRLTSKISSNLTWTRVTDPRSVASCVNILVDDPFSLY